MAVKLRLRRLGRRKRPLYAVVAADERSPRDGRYIEDLGRYAPVQEPATVTLNQDRILYWLSQGAQPSDTVRSLLHKQGLMLTHALRAKGTSEEDIASEVEAFLARQADKDTGVKLTAADRRREALKEEAARAAEQEKELRRQAEELRKLREEEERRQAEKAAAEAAEAKAAEEAEAAEAEGAAEPVTDAEGAEPSAAAPEGTDVATDEAEGVEPEVKKEDEVPAPEETETTDAEAAADAQDDSADDTDEEEKTEG